MASGQGLADSISTSIDILVEFMKLAYRIWNLPAQQNWQTKIYTYLLALPEAFAQASNLTQSLARSHEQATALSANWTDANGTDQVMTTVNLTIGLVKSSLPDVISETYNYFWKGHFRVNFRSLCRNSSLESKVGMMCLLAWLIFCASSYSVRWLMR